MQESPGKKPDWEFLKILILVLNFALIGLQFFPV